MPLTLTEEEKLILNNGVQMVKNYTEKVNYYRDKINEYQNEISNLQSENSGLDKTKAIEGWQAQIESAKRLMEFMQQLGKELHEKMTMARDALANDSIHSSATIAELKQSLNDIHQQYKKVFTNYGIVPPNRLATASEIKQEQKPDVVQPTPQVEIKTPLQTENIQKISREKEPEAKPKLADKWKKFVGEVKDQGLKTVVQTRAYETKHNKFQAKWDSLGNKSDFDKAFELLKIYSNTKDFSGGSFSIFKPKDWGKHHMKQIYEAIKPWTMIAISTLEQDQVKPKNLQKLLDDIAKRVGGNLNDKGELKAILDVIVQNNKEGAVFQPSVQVHEDRIKKTI